MVVEAVVALVLVHLKLAAQAVLAS